MCDGIDNDCDAQIDDADGDSPPVDAPSWFFDDDGDGFGDPSRVAVSCLAPAGHVLLGGDCNDGDDTIAPGIAEDPCDGIDNDCDNVIDFNVVPRDFATLQQAIDAAPTLTPTTICVEPGAHAGPMVLDDHEITLLSRAGAGGTTLDHSGLAGPFIEVTGSSTLVVEGFTVTGLDNARGIVPIPGAFVDLVVPPGLSGGDELTLRDVVIDQPRITVGDELTGGVVHVEYGDTLLRDVEVTGLEATLTGSVSALRGAFLSVLASDLTVEGLSVVDTVVASAPTAQACFYEGGVVYASTNGQIEVRDFDVSGGAFDLDCPLQAFAIGSAAYFRNATVLGGGWTLADNTVLASGAQAFGYGLVFQESGNLLVGDLGFVDNVIDVDATTLAAAQGPLTLAPLVVLPQITGLDAIGNLVRAVGPPEAALAYGGALSTTSNDRLDIEGIDARGNEVVGDVAFGGAIFVLSPSLLVDDSVFAGNVVGGAGATRAFGGAIHLDTPGGNLGLEHIDFVGNRAEGSIEARGGAVSSRTASGTLIPNVLHVSFVDNAVAGTTTVGAALDSPNAPFVRHSNTFGNGGAEAYPGYTPSSSSGNLFVEPEYVDVSGADARTWDLRLRPGSPLVDAGLPFLTDPDGTPPDIGAYGGPNAP